MEKLILTCGLSPGDVVTLTAAVRDLHAAHPRRYVTDVRTPCPALWENNPHITRIEDGDPEARVIQMEYPLIQKSNQTAVHFLDGYREYLAEQLGRPIARGPFKGGIYLSDAERGWMSQVEEMRGAGTRFWIIVSGGKRDFTAKWWDVERYQAVVKHFEGRILFVQVGEAGHEHPALDGVLDLRGKTDLRQLVRLMYHADGVLCPVTSLMHLAAAVPWKHSGGLRPCVVVAGGREPAHWEAYPGHRFLHTIGQLPCCDLGGCWKARVVPLGDGDEKDKSVCERPVEIRPGVNLPACLDRITAEDVIRAVESYLIPAPPVRKLAPVAVDEKKPCCGGDVTAPKSDDPAVWGPKKWAELHARPAVAPDAAKETAWLMKWMASIPCEECREHFATVFGRSPPTLEDMDTYFEWTVRLHDAVNAKLGKPVFGIKRAQAAREWRNGHAAREATCMACEYFILRETAPGVSRYFCGAANALVKPLIAGGNCPIGKWAGPSVSELPVESELVVEPVPLLPVTMDNTATAGALGVVIGTFAALPYIHLQLEAARRFYPGVPLLVHDDGSPQREALAALCARYGAGFVAADERKAQFLGDLSVYRAGLLWAQENGIGYLLKLSRRWIWTEDWTQSFLALIAESDAYTVSHHCLANGFGFRTECVGFCVSAWGHLPAWVGAKLEADVNIFVEFDIHRLAEQVAARGSEKWRAYEAALSRAADRRGYAPWLLMGDSRHTAVASHLWHNSHPKEEYARLASEWRLPYTPTDFADPNAGCGDGYQLRK